MRQKRIIRVPMDFSVQELGNLVCQIKKPIMYTRRINHNQRNSKRRPRHGVSLLEKQNTLDFSSILLLSFIIVVLIAIFSVDDADIVTWLNTFTKP